ncbi:HD-GYP domain-containing protein [Arenimonas alkanexedens]
MALEERQILVGLLEKGMFVSRLDRDWVGTPFPFQGFHVATDKDIELLAEYCSSVFIDVIKSSVPARRLQILSRSSTTFPPRTHEYRNSVELQDEMPRAREAHTQARKLAERLEADVRSSRRLIAGDIQDAIEPMVESLIRNVDAFFWLMALLSRDDYAYSHAVHCSALAAAFGRHLALPRETLSDLATGGMLLDIGKASLPEESFKHPGPLSPEARALMRGHVAEGLKVFDESGLKGAWARDILAGHHERHDGSGYPNSLKGDQIPLAARMGGIIDSYDAICSDRPHAKGTSRHAALQTIYRAGETLYQGEVVEQFLQCLCVYPTGSLVELSSGEVGIVLAQNQARRLRPRVMLLLDADKRSYSPYRDIDLMAVEHQAGGRTAVRIVASLEPGAHGLDPSALFLA